jgi:hypothetical protein
MVQLGPGGRRVGATPRTSKRSLDSSTDSPRDGGRNVGAVPNHRNVGATPHRRPHNVGATPRDPLQDLMDQLKGDTPPDDYNDYPYDQQPYYGNNGYSNNIYAGSNNNNVGAVRNSPWKGFFDQFKSWGSSLWGNNKQKRAIGRTVSPNRATINGHNFNLEMMPTEEQFEMYNAIFNRTRYEDLAGSLLRYEIN